MTPPPTPDREKELEMMQTPDNWPVWPYLPLKRRPIKTDEDIGLLMERGPTIGVKPTVYLCNLFAPSLEDFVEYKSFEELVDDGWVVD